MKPLSFLFVVTENSKWEGASHWVNWWIRPAHLRMLSQAFTEMPKAVWENAPSTKNAVERKNLDSKQKHPVQLKNAMIRAYTFDKSFCLRYIDASENVRQSYTNHTAETVRKQAANKAHQRLNQRVPNDKLAVHGPQTRPQIFKVVRNLLRPKVLTHCKPKKQKLRWLHMDHQQNLQNVKVIRDLMRSTKVTYHKQKR